MLPFSVSFCLFLSRCLKGKDNLGGEGVRQMEMSMAKCTYRNPALGLFPAFRNFETHGSQQARVVCKSCWGGFTQALLPAPKATCMPTHTSGSRWFLLFSI